MAEDIVLHLAQKVIYYQFTHCCRLPAVEHDNQIAGVADFVLSWRRNFVISGVNESHKSILPFKSLLPLLQEEKSVLTLPTYCGPFTSGVYVRDQAVLLLHVCLFDNTDLLFILLTMKFIYKFECSSVKVGKKVENFCSLLLLLLFFFKSKTRF